jgi:ribosomal protein S18 acetylase RimI-like enzyme
MQNVPRDVKLQRSGCKNGGLKSTAMFQNHAKPMTDAATVRLATPADAQALHELSRRTVIDTFAHLNDPTDFADFLEKHYDFQLVAADLADPAVRVLLCEVDSSPAAYARLSSREIPACIGDGNSIQIERFYVDRPHIGQGMAAKMMERCLQLASQGNRSTIFLGVWEHNARAIRFYEKWGFARCGEHPFMVGTDRQIDWWMKRPVAG